MLFCVYNYVVAIAAAVAVSAAAVAMLCDVLQSRVCTAMLVAAW